MKNYRDLVNHHVVVSADARFFVDAGGIPYLFLVLPNNPEEHSPSALRYEAPHVHAMQYAVESFWQLYAFAFDLAVLLLRHIGTPRVAVVSMGIKAAFPLGPKGVVGLPATDPEAIVQSVAVLRERLREKWNLPVPNDR